MGHNTSAKTTTQLRKEIARLQRELTDLRQHNPTDTVFAPPSPSDQEHIITHLQDAVIITNLEFSIQSWNDAATQLYGWTAQEVIGRHIGEILPVVRYLNGQDSEAAINDLEHNKFWRGEVIQRCHDKSERVISSSVQVLRDAKDQPQAYIAINRDISAHKKSEDALWHYAERLNILHHMNQRTLAGHPLELIAEEVLNRLRRLVAVDQASVLLYNADMSIGTVLGISGATPDWPAVGEVINLRSFMPGVITRIRHPRIFHDIAAPSVQKQFDIPPEIASMALKMGIRAVLSIPLTVNGMLIGSLNLSTSAPQSFPDDHVIIAREVGTYLAISIQASRLRENERRARQIAETLHRASMALTQSLDLNQVLEALLDYLQELVPYDSANVLLRDGWIFQVYSLRGYDHRVNLEDIRMIAFDARKHRITGTILESQQSLLISDTLGYPGWVEIAGGEEIRSWMGIPILSQGEVLGIYAVNKMIPGFFTQESVAMAETLSTVVAAGITNALLYARAQQELNDRRRAEENLEAERALLARRVTERTADLIAANAELARASRMKDEFLANMSHELRTPLNTVLGRAEILREQIYGPLSDQQQYAISSIEESGRHLLALINDILDLSKIEAGKLELQIDLIDVAALCQTSVRMVAQDALTKGINLTSTLDMSIEYMYADERRLKQILVNLLSNAVKFTPKGGSVNLEIRGLRNLRQIEFIVTDTGIGIAETDLPRLFQPFVQIDASLSRQHEGTGLGLSLVMRLTEAHNGSVAVTSTLGKGSCFSITLPWDLATQSYTPTDEREELLPQLGNVLIIEDSPASIEQLRRYLGDLDCIVHTHHQAGGALNLAINLNPDLILLDIILPDQTGWSVLSQLKSDPRTFSIPVLVISVVDEPDLARQLGAEAHLLKPITRIDLLRTLRQIARTQPKSPPLTVASTAHPPMRRILLAEDNEDNISLLMDYLPIQGYELRVARDGNEAILMARMLHPEAILMDIQMPVMDGLEATRQIRADKELSNTPVIALTALAMPGDRERCLEAGADAYLIKPVSLRDLPAQIEEAIRQRSTKE